MTMPGPNFECYGPAARLAAVADHVEVEALRRGEPFRLAEVVEALSESRIRPRYARIGDRLEERDAEASADEDQDDAVEVDRLFTRHNVESEILSREQILGEHYPFRLDAGALVPRPRVDSERTTYAVLLAVSQLHAGGDHHAWEELEDIAERVFRAAGLTPRRLGGLRGGFARFAAALSLALQELRVEPSTFNRNALVRPGTNEAGIDLLARTPHATRTDGAAFSVVVQVTCGRTDALAQKLGEAVKVPFTEWFGWSNSPVPALVVPYGLDAPTRREVQRGYSGPSWVLARPDLVALRPAADPAEVPLVRRLLDSAA